MAVAIIGGTGFYKMFEGDFVEVEVETRYGSAVVYQGQNEHSGLFFLPRHGVAHTIPPHKINYRANITALKKVGVERILATFAVGSINTGMEPGCLVALDQFLDFTSGRPLSFFDGGEAGLAHVEVNDPYCKNLRLNLIGQAPKNLLTLISGGTYVTTNGPRFETPAEIKMYAQIGGDVVGMTGVPEVVLAREMEIHYAAVAHSINWAAGIQPKIEIVREGIEETRQSLLQLFVDVLGQPFIHACECEGSLMVSHMPSWDN